MPKSIPQFRKGDTLTAEWMESLRKEVIRSIRVAAPLQLSDTATGTYISWAGSNGTALRVGTATEEIAWGAEGTISLYKPGTTDEDKEVEATNLFGQIESSDTVIAFQGGSEWYCFTVGEEEEVDPEGLPLRSAFLVVVGGCPESGTVGFAVRTREIVTVVDEESGEETEEIDEHYGEFEVNIVGTTGDEVLEMIHDALGYTTDQEKAQVRSAGGGGGLKYNSFYVASTLKTFTLFITSADIPPASGGWPTYARVYRSMVADFDDLEA